MSKNSTTKIKQGKSRFNNIVDSKINNDTDNKDTNDDQLDETVIGIDLGTRFSCVSVWRNKSFEIICDQFGNRTIPSIVAFYKSAKLVGHNALSMKEVNPDNTIYDIKRIIGRRMTDPIVEQTKKLISYDIVDDQSEHHNILIRLNKKEITRKILYTPEEICSQILLEIKKMASTYLQKEITKAIITVPAYFNDAQRQATLDAGKIAGLDVLKIINEPTAAALAYGLGNKYWEKKSKSDSGSKSKVNSSGDSKSKVNSNKGSKSKVNSSGDSKSKVNSNKGSKSRVNSSRGSKSGVNSSRGSKSGVNSNKGSKSGVNSSRGSKSGVNSNKGSKSRVNSSEDSKSNGGSKSSENKQNFTTTGGNIIMYDLGAGTLDVSLMNISNGVFRTLAVGGNGHLGGEDIDYLVMNHIIIEFQKQNKIRELKISKLAQLKLKNSVENAKKILSATDKAVVCVDDFCNGKKLYQVITREFFELTCNELFIMCIKPLNDVLESAKMKKDDIDEVILVGGSTRIPKIQKLILDFFNDTKIKHLTTSLNPDEVVSAGASIYGYIMTHKDDPFSKDLFLADITPLSLGIETLQKQMTIVIPRNTVIPTKKIKVFTTDTDNQDTVSIKIFEGERKLTKNNFHVGTFDLTGFEKGPRGYPIIRITFHIDINGILQVTAHEKRSDVQNTVQITSTWGAKGRMSKDDIDNIIEEAEKYEQIDTIYSAKIGLLHKINNICNAIIINLKDDAFSLTNADKKKIRIELKNNLKWIKDKELSEFNIDELEKREDDLSKKYAPLIALTNKKNENFKDTNQSSNTAEIHGDDDDNENLQQYEKIHIPNDPSEYEKEEIKALKKTISDLGKNILSVINNPISNFSEEDIMTMSDYIGSVHIWLYTTTATTTIEFIAKINEINKFTEEIMKKYEDTKIFEKNDSFTTREELQLTCLTLNTSIKNNFFSIKKNDIDKLSKFINETMIWLLTHQNEESNIYQEKLNEISEMCNSMYHETHKMKVLENINLVSNENDDSDFDEDNSNEEINNTVSDIPEGNKINENIGDLINKLPDKLIAKNIITPPKNGDVLLKIDINKLNSGNSFRYKNVEQHCR